MTIARLQRDRGIVPEQSKHEEMLEAYGYRQLTQLVVDLPALATHAFHALGTRLGAAMNFRLGPPVADAATVMPGKSAVDDFVRKFSADFDINLNGPARNAGDMRGMIILIGEDHNDLAVQGLIRKVMRGFDRDRGDRFFVEGWEAEQCNDRVAYYDMKSEDCRLLENKSKAFAKLLPRLLEFEHGLENYISFLIQHVPEATKEMSTLNLKDISAFFRRYAGKLPASRIAKFNEMGRQLEALQERSEHETKLSMPARDAWMADVVRKDRTTRGLNYIIVGADHVAGIRDRLEDLPVLRVVPRSLFTEFPHLKEEL